LAPQTKLQNDPSHMHQFHFSGSPRPIFSWRPFGGLAILFAAVSVIHAAPPAEARQLTYYDSFFQGWLQTPQQAYRSRRHERAPDRRPVERRPVERDSAEQKAVEGKKPSGPLYAVVSLADQHISFYDANGLWERSVVSTGVAGHPTPPGIFTILEKERWHRSNIYSGAPMPYMQRLAWTGVAMHEGVVTGRPASHGCIRLPGAFAKRVFGLTNVGQRVVISSQDVTPSDIVNAHLPVPQLQTQPAGAEDKTAAIKRGNAVETVALDKPAAGEDPRLLNPVQFAQALKIASAANAASAAQAKKAALALAAAKSDDVRQAARELSVAEESIRRAKAEIEEANRSMARAQGDEAVKKATDRKLASEAKLAEAERKVREASETKAAKDKELVSAQNAVREADEQASAASASAKDATIRAEPISIFISRKNKHLYVRQATQHLFDMPITIRDPERPLGTHLFIATRARDDGASLHWVGLTPPAAVEVKHRSHSSRRGRMIEPEDETLSLKPLPEAASAALDRIELPPEAVQRIAERTWVGATLIISDVGMSGEGRYPMDFMILSHTILRED
jgi:lipoprotein-anchoring transpeptidase ErfK/SrfK